MLIMGIDPSINSTGICIYNEDKPADLKYYIIASHMTKKMKAFRNKYIKYIPYEKAEVSKLEYSEREAGKTNNIYNICKGIQSLCKKHKPDLVIMEGVSYGSTGSAALVDLSGLQYAIRITLITNKVPFKIVSPTSVKKFAVANGQAEKYIIIDAWKRLDKNIADINDIKIDDLADSYFMAHYKD